MHRFLPSDDIYTYGISVDFDTKLLVGIIGLDINGFINVNGTSEDLKILYTDTDIFAAIFAFNPVKSYNVN